MKINPTKECIVLRHKETGEIIEVFKSCREAARYLGVTGQTVCNILDGRVRRSVKIKHTLVVEPLE
jgi:hypothetical protein